MKRPEPPAAPSPAVSPADMPADMPAADAPASQAPAPEFTDADLPPVDSLPADADLRPFFSPKVSEALRRAALRHLFRQARFNVHDGLDDYCGDYRHHVPLGDRITADMQHQLDRLQARLDRERHQPPAQPPPAASAPEPSDAVPTPAAEPAATPLPPDADDEPSR